MLTFEDYLERQTRYFPYIMNNTMMYMARRSNDFNVLLDPLKRYLLSAEIEDRCVDIAYELIARLHRSAMVSVCWISLFSGKKLIRKSNDVRIFPHLSKAQRERKETYLELLSELYRFAKDLASTPNHQKIVRAMERMWPEQCNVVPQDSECTRECANADFESPSYQRGAVE
jgi:hypothetical protein